MHTCGACGCVFFRMWWFVCSVIYRGTGDQEDAVKSRSPPSFEAGKKNGNVRSQQPRTWEAREEE